MAQQIQWTVAVTTKDGQRQIGMYPTKKQAVSAMMGIRAPGTPIYLNGNNYVVSEKK